MKEYPSTAITRHSGEILDDAMRSPVAITRYRRPAFIIMSTEHYDRITARNTRTVGTIGTVSPAMRDEMLAAIEAELSNG
jgi:PHD/YefM family antitoxin component YafN of YafNO toxin-antitoxin module